MKFQQDTQIVNPPPPLPSPPYPAVPKPSQDTLHVRGGPSRSPAGLRDTPNLNPDDLAFIN